MAELPSYLASGETARLIPVAADTSKEVRAASILLATLGAVPQFARCMLADIGQRVGARTNLECFTEVVFGHSPNGDKRRPDGLIVLQTGQGRLWRCLVEAKVGRAEIDPDQITKYLALAKANSIDAVLSVSNQFVALPTHSPIRLPRNAARGVDLLHWSWMHVLTQAKLLLHEGDFERPEQRYLLSEMVRYFEHPSIGVSTFDRMNREWKDLVLKVHAGAPLIKTSPEVENTIASWHQECRDLALLLSRQLNRRVGLKLARAHAGDAAAWLRADADELAVKQELRCTLEIPDAAAPLVVAANLPRRTVAVSMALAAPKERQRSSSRINWILRQLAKADAKEAHITAMWPGRTQPTQAPLSVLREDPTALESPNASSPPVGFEVMLVRDLAGRFSGAKTFIEELERAVPDFYERLGQHVRAYVPTPPKLERTAKKEKKPKAEADQGENNIRSPLEETSEPPLPQDVVPPESPISVAPDPSENLERLDEVGEDVPASDVRPSESSSR